MNIFEVCRDRLDVDFEKGMTFWKNQNRHGFWLGGRRAGCRVKKSTKYGSPKFYRAINVSGKSVLEHRFIAFMAGMDIEGKEVDHINGNSEDNRLCNLRVVSRQENCKNIKLASNNTTGVAGVYWEKDRKKWTASIPVNRKNKRLGSFESFNEAVKARKRAEIEMGYHWSHGACHIRKD